MKPLILAFFAAMALLGRAADAAADTITIKLGTLAPEGSPWHDALRDMGEAWKQATNGAVVLRIYAGGTLGDEPTMVQMMRIGQLQAAALSGAGQARRLQLSDSHHLHQAGLVAATAAGADAKLYLAVGRLPPRFAYIAQRIVPRRSLRRQRAEFDRDRVAGDALRAADEQRC